MKKYHQLLLLVTSLISLTLFLVYRHEYNRLHYILEVFNFFGQPCNISGTEISTNILSHHDWGPTPLWQQTDNVNVYSAFWTDKNEVKAIILQDDQPVVVRNCYLWFENKKKPVVGKFRYSKIATDESGKESVYFFYCGLTTNHTPYSVSFGTKLKKPSHLKKVLITNTQTHSPSVNTTICISPTDFDKAKFVEFLSFHNLIGVDSFIFYGGDIPHRLTKIITNLSRRLGIKTTYFPWNFPKGDTFLSRIIVENDCILRNTNQSNYVITLELNEYVVPANIFTFNDIVKNFDGRAERLSLPVQKFCIENTRANRPIAEQNIKVAYNDDSATVNIFRRNFKGDVIVTRAVDKGIASVHKYVHCREMPMRTYVDNSILKFATDFTRSTLVQLLIHNQL